jgi:methionyl-tRNA formyltransferase
MKKANLIFLGSPAFAVPALQLLIESGDYTPVAVITQPDKPAGRKMQLTATPVKELAVQHHIPCLQPEDVNAPEFVQQVRDLQPDLLITVAYGAKLRKPLRETARLGAVNLHPSLLPELRGAAPVPFALWDGMTHTGITIFRLASRMDAGPVYHQKPYYIFPDENATDLLERLSRIGAMQLLSWLESWLPAPTEPTPQDESKATYCRKLSKEDCRIDWSLPASQIHNQIMALAQTPGAYTLWQDYPLKILASEVLLAPATVIPAQAGIQSPQPGTVTALHKNTGFVVQTGDISLLIHSVQPAGKKPMSAWAFHLGSRISIGERLL